MKTKSSMQKEGTKKDYEYMQMSEITRRHYNITLPISYIIIMDSKGKIASRVAKAPPPRGRGSFATPRQNRGW